MSKATVARCWFVLKFPQNRWQQLFLLRLGAGGWWQQHTACMTVLKRSHFLTTRSRLCLVSMTGAKFLRLRGRNLNIQVKTQYYSQERVSSDQGDQTWRLWKQSWRHHKWHCPFATRWGLSKLNGFQRRVQLFFLSIKSHILVASAEQVDLEKYSPVCVEPEDQTGTSSGQVIGEQFL